MIALAGYPFSILSSTIPILTTVDVVSLCVFIPLLRFTEERKNQPDLSHHELVNYVFKILLGPNFIASMTTMIGFLALLTVKVPLIRDYGVTAAGSIIIGWLVTTALLFPLLHFLPGPRAREWAWRKARWGLYLFRRSGVWAFLIILVCSALAIKGQSLSWSARLFDDLPTNHQVRLSTETIDKELGGMIPVDIEIKGVADIWNDPKLLAQLDQLSSDIRKIGGVGSVVGLPDLVAAANIHHSRLPASRSATAEIFFLYSLSNNSPLKNFLNTDSSNTRISVRTQDLPANELHSLVAEIRGLATERFPNMKVEISGMGSTIHHLNNELSHELIFGFWQSMAAIFLVLIFVFKSVRWALIACIPNLVPPAALLGFLAVSETPIKPSSVAIIFSIALGLAFNNTVYLLERLKLIQKTSKSKELEIEKSVVARRKSLFNIKFDFTCWVLSLHGLLFCHEPDLWFLHAFVDACWTCRRFDSSTDSAEKLPLAVDSSILEKGESYGHGIRFILSPFISFSRLQLKPKLLLRKSGRRDESTSALSR